MIVLEEETQVHNDVIIDVKIIISGMEIVVKEIQ
jgi:hypothetical protein